MVSRFTKLFRRMRGDDDCIEVREMSSDFIDGELDDASVERVSSHISRCGPCNAFINTLRSTIEMLRSSPKRQAPDDLQRRIRQRIQQERAD